MTDLRKRAEEILIAECVGADKFPCHIDAMLAFAAEERKKAIADCVAMCYFKGETRAAEAIDNGVPK